MIPKHKNPIYIGPTFIWLLLLITKVLTALRVKDKRDTCEIHVVDSTELKKIEIFLCTDIIQHSLNNSESLILIGLLIQEGTIFEMEKRDAFSFS